MADRHAAIRLLCSFDTVRLRHLGPASVAHAIEQQSLLVPSYLSTPAEWRGDPLARISQDLRHWGRHLLDGVDGDRLILSREAAGLRIRRAAGLARMHPRRLRTLELGQGLLTSIEAMRLGEVYDVRPEWLAGYPLGLTRATCRTIAVARGRRLMTDVAAERMFELMLALSGVEPATVQPEQLADHTLCRCIGSRLVQPQQAVGRAS